ncbi:cation transporter [Salegentibacter salinarum]|uniref:Cation transporter n=1 Tax=Salegentibacter salinarum TaxID=447422 RepID=A0A2N0TN85_9FLAO|nr:cation diffusion facilitator family transporter [Salegentibacter salinarum]PKD16186.1 cation transporter [Salegentibacter salinarum]SKB68190.1 cobalt-zinc-cadmium efflux system protein [Salegentibacter salinarum]
MANNHEHINCNRDNHNHNPAGNKRSKKSALSLAFWLNFFFSIIELIGGILTNSTAIIADAFHDFMDAGAIGLAILLENVSDKKRTAKFSYGYKRFSLLAALGLSIFLLAGSVTMVFAAYNSFINPKEIHSVGMLWLAVLGLAVNGFAFLRIKNEGGHHHQGHNHNSESIMLHLFEDVLGWAVVLIGAAIIHFTGWNWIDGFLTIAIALYIGINASKNLINTLKVMLQSVPENVDLSHLETDLHKIEGITNIHDLHVWSLDGSYNVGSLHAVVNNATGKAEQDILNKIIKLMRKHRIQHPTVQIETNFNRCQLKHC